MKLIVLAMVLALTACGPKPAPVAVEVPKVVVAAAPAEDNRMELEKMGAVKASPSSVKTDAPAPAVTPAAKAQAVPKEVTPVTVVAKKSKKKSVGFKNSVKMKAPVTAVSGFPDVAVFKKMPAKEQRAYLEAAVNEQRADCLDANLDRKVAVENAMGKGIQDWGNVRTMTCKTDGMVDGMMAKLHPVKAKKAKK